MSFRRLNILLLAAAGIMAACSAPSDAQDVTPRAQAAFAGPSGQEMGHAELRQTPHGVLMHVTLEGLSPGAHAFHIHEAGRCAAPDFTSAGGHFNPLGADHGLLVDDGPHAGDFPNIHVGNSGSLTFEVISDRVTLAEGEISLFDAGGSAFVIHAGPDDYRSQPSGSAGTRSACAVIAKAQ